MNYTRTFNVLTLTAILFLAGCFGIGDSAEAADDHEHTPNAAPVISLEQPNYQDSSFQCDQAAGTCQGTLYHAVVDPEGDAITMGWDFDLDGNVDVSVTTNRGYTNLIIPSGNWLPAGGAPEWTSIAFIAVDSNDAHSAAISLVWVEGAGLPDDYDEWEFLDRDASDDMSENNGEDLVHLMMTEGALGWDVLKVVIVVDDGAAYTCEEAGTADADCTYTIDSDSTWSAGEEITISEGDVDLCDGANGGCNVDITLTKIGVGGEADVVIAMESAYADAN
ncbi:MAG: hypothetical protein ACJZ5D_01975 [Candidatus Thalassarchaeaceae archaeon]